MKEAKGLSMVRIVSWGKLSIYIQNFSITSFHSVNATFSECVSPLRMNRMKKKSPAFLKYWNLLLFLFLFFSLLVIVMCITSHRILSYCTFCFVGLLYGGWWMAHSGISINFIQISCINSWDLLLSATNCEFYIIFFFFFLMGSRDTCLWTTIRTLFMHFIFGCSMFMAMLQIRIYNINIM